jgi:hypothetical protein
VTAVDLDSFSDDELAEERDFLLRSLADLDAEREAGDIDEHDYGTLRDGYTSRAAAVLRTLDARGAEGERAWQAPAGAAAPGPETTGPETTGPETTGPETTAERVRPVARHAKPARRWRTPLIMAAVVAFAVAAGVGVARSSGQRPPGATITGSTPGSTEEQMLAGAAQDFQKGNVLGAIQTYDKVLASDPANAEALTYKGWLLRLAGDQAHDQQLIDGGLASIQQAEQVDPAYPDAHFFAGEILLRDKNDPKDAIVEFQTYLADNPPAGMEPEVEGEIQAAQSQLDGTLPAGASPEASTPTTTPGAGAAGPAASTPPAP